GLALFQRAPAVVEGVAHVALETMRQARRGAAALEGVDGDEAVAHGASGYCMKSQYFTFPAQAQQRTATTREVSRTPPGASPQTTHGPPSEDRMHSKSGREAA